MWWWWSCQLAAVPPSSHQLRRCRTLPSPVPTPRFPQSLRPTCAPQKRLGVWDRLEAVGDKSQILRRRNESIDASYRRAEEARQHRQQRKQQEEK